MPLLLISLYIIHLIFSIELNHRRIIENQMVYKDGFYEMDYDAFEKAIVENDVKIVYFM